MPEEATPAPDNSSINATINAVAGLAQAIPVYQDALQPAAKEVGKSLELVGKVVNIALAPLRGVVWGYEKIEGFITERVGEKLKNVPPENIITPAANVVGPAIEALKFSGEDVNLRELYANLIANAMDKGTSSNTHPAFVEIIRTISGEEAMILNYFSSGIIEPIIDVKLSNKDANDASYTLQSTNHSLLAKKIGLTKGIEHVPTYLNNLCRLGLLDIPHGKTLSDASRYKDVESDFDTYKDFILSLNPTKQIAYIRKIVQVTNFGYLFINTVVKDKE